MLKYFKQLAGDSLIYGISSVITSFISLLLVPVYTKIFSPTEYGVLNLVNVTFFLLNIFVVCGLDNSAAYWFWDKTELIERKRTFASWFWFQSLASVFFALITITFSVPLSRLILASPDHALLFIIGGANLPFLATHRVLTNWFRLQRKPFPTVLFALAISLSMILLSILLVVYFRIGIKGVLIAQLASSIIGAAVVIFKLHNWLSPVNFDKERLRVMLKYAAPLVPAALSFWLLSSAGSYVIQYFCSKDEVGLYQIGISFAGIVSIVVMAFNQAWPPFALSISKEEGHQLVYANILLLFFGLGSFLAAGMWIFAPEILALLTNKNYFDASDVIGILSFNVFMNGVVSIVSIGCNLAKTNKPYGQAVIVASILTGLLYFLFVPLYGKIGAAVATLTGSLFITIYVAYKANKLYPVPYNWIKCTGFLLLAAVFITLGRYIHPQVFHYDILWKAFIYIAYCLVLALWNKKTIFAIFSKRPVA